MLLDSNILIYAADPGYDHLRQFIAKIEPVASVISKVEVLGYQKLSLRSELNLRATCAKPSGLQNSPEGASLPTSPRVQHTVGLLREYAE